LANQVSYVRYTITRLSGCWNLLWNVTRPLPNALRSWLAAKAVQRLDRSNLGFDPFDHPL
jgi:hypothetical protein